MRILARIAAIASLLAATLTATGAGLATASASAVVGHVYVNNNTVENTISGFDRHADGTLTPIAGTPFAAGGAGTGSPTGSAGALERSADGRFLIAVDAGSNQVSVLKIKHDGSLKLADVVSSNGVAPISVTTAGNLVYVANLGNQGGSNYTGFRINAAGISRRSPTRRSPCRTPRSPARSCSAGTGGTSLACASAPAPVRRSSTASRSGADGRLTARTGSPFPAQKIGPFGSSFRPTNPDQLFVSNAHDGAGNGTVSVYDVAADRHPHGDQRLTVRRPADRALLGGDHPGGNTLFAVNTGSSSISGYAIGPMARSPWPAARRSPAATSRRSTRRSIRRARTCTSSTPARRRSAPSRSAARPWWSSAPRRSRSPAAARHSGWSSTSPSPPKRSGRRSDPPPAHRFPTGARALWLTVNGPRRTRYRCHR